MKRKIRYEQEKALNVIITGGGWSLCLGEIYCKIFSILSSFGDKKRLLWHASEVFKIVFVKCAKLKYYFLVKDWKEKFGVLKFWEIKLKLSLEKLS